MIEGLSSIFWFVINRLSPKMICQTYRAPMIATQKRKDTREFPIRNLFWIGRNDHMWKKKIDRRRIVIRCVVDCTCSISFSPSFLFFFFFLTLSSDPLRDHPRNKYTGKNNDASRIPGRMNGKRGIRAPFSNAIFSKRSFLVPNASSLRSYVAYCRSDNNNNNNKAFCRFDRRYTKLITKAFDSIRVSWLNLSTL